MPLSILPSASPTVGNIVDALGPDGNTIKAVLQAVTPTATDGSPLAGAMSVSSSATWQYAGIAGGIVDTADVAIKAAAGAGVRNYLTNIQFINTSATASEIVVKDGTTIIWRGYAPASGTQVNSVEFNTPLRGTANTALNVAMITTATATRVSAQGYTAA